MFQRTGQSVYLNEAKNVWQFLKNNLWEESFGGLVASIDRSDRHLRPESVDFKIVFESVPIARSVLSEPKAGENATVSRRIGIIP